MMCLRNDFSVARNFAKSSARENLTSSFLVTFTETKFPFLFRRCSLEVCHCRLSTEVTELLFSKSGVLSQQMLHTLYMQNLDNLEQADESGNSSILLRFNKCSRTSLFPRSCKFSCSLQQQVSRVFKVGSKTKKGLSLQNMA